MKESPETIASNGSINIQSMSHLFSPEQTVVVYNPISGTTKTKPRAHRMVKLLKEHGYTISLTQASNHATKLVEEAAKDGKTAAIIIGGDGSLYEGIAKLPPHMPLAYFPGGSVNLFALNLNIPQKPEAWLELLQSESVRSVRFGLCNDRPFASVASVGFDAQVVAETSSQMKRTIHQAAFAVQFVSSLMTYKQASFKVTIDGVPLSEEVSGVIIGRGQHYGGPNKILLPCEPNGTELSYIMLLGKSKWYNGKYAVGMLTETLPKMKDVLTGHANEISIETEPDSCVQLDGDFYGKTPVVFKAEAIEHKVLAKAS
jgi:diacylglycerol kinase (ATP)